MNMGKKQANRAVWRNGNFTRLWLGTVLSAFGDGAIFILLSWFVIDVTGSEAMLGTTLLCISVPRLLFMLAGGVLADRISRKWIMSMSVMARALVLILFSLLLLFVGDSYLRLSVYVMAVIFGIVDAFFWPARNSIMPSLVMKDQLPAANSIMETSQQLSMVGGPLIASLLLQTMAYPYMFLSIAALFLVSMLLIFSLRPLPADHAGAADHTDAEAYKSSPLRDLVDGIRYVLTIRILTIIMVVSLFLNVAFAGPINIGLPVLVKQLGWEGSAFGYLEGAIGVGAIAGGIITGLANGFRSRYKFLPLLLGLLGVSVASLYVMNDLSFGFVMMLIGGMMLSMTNIPLITYIQTIVSTNKLGRVMSLLSLMSMGLQPVSYTLSSFLLDQKIFTPQTLLLLGGSMMTVMGVSILLLRDFRNMEKHPEWQKLGAAIAEKSTEQSVS